ncbi:MAG: hypothetical protein OJF62_001033 [Pseudolabrys sp.]|jgi:hypothetical protein|nr:hypothetical protein [Pseudolabrys sp.]
MATKGNKPGGAWHEDGKIVDGKVVSLGRDVQFKIGQHLRTMYDEVVKQGVPDQLSNLLSQLDSASEAKKTDDDKSAG